MKAKKGINILFYLHEKYKGGGVIVRHLLCGDNLPHRKERSRKKKSIPLSGLDF
jgi:hypothetical protein